MTYRSLRSRSAALALLPAWIAAGGAFVGSVVWMAQISFTSSRLLPVNDFIGFDNYINLLGSRLWQTAFNNMLIFGGLYISACMVLGCLMAIALDQKLKAEAFWRTVFLYPYAMSFIVTGLVWQWIMNPEMGVQNAIRDMGWASFTFDLSVRRSTAIYAIAIAAVWHGAGLVMALMLSAIRGIDENIWKATAIDGIPKWRTYLQIVLPMCGPALWTSLVLLMLGVVKLYDIVVALTNGGPGIASEVPAKFIMDHLFTRQEIGTAAAAAMMLLLTMFIVVAPFRFLAARSSRRLSQ